MAVTTPLGAVIREAEGIRLEFVRTFPESIDRVWSAVTDPHELTMWFGTWRGDPSTGHIELCSLEGDGTYKLTQIAECDPPHTVAIVLPSPDGPWPVSLSLSESDGGTTMVFVHRLAEPYDARSVGPGWHYYLDRLAAAVSGQTVPEGGDWPSYEQLASSYPLPD